MSKTVNFLIFMLCSFILENVNPNQLEWVLSQNISSWYTPFDLCMLEFNSSTVSIDDMMSICTKNIKPNEVLPPLRCRAGNAWPLRSGFCSPFDLPFSERINFRKSVRFYDDPSQKPLKKLFSRLSVENGALLLIGDSVMQQFFGAIACELEREGLWNDPKSFRNTDEIKYVTPNISGHSASLKTPFSVPVRFVPIYHFVDGRYDRVKNASIHHLNTSIEHFLRDYDSLFILFNVGLHYVGGGIPQFNREDFRSQVTMALTYIQNIVLTRPEKKIRVYWRETTAQHFPTPTGYWPGMRYAANMKVGCVKINDTSPDANWRNTDIETIIRDRGLDKIKIAHFYNLTVPLWTEHVNGNLKDCTHLCWTPMLYQPLFHIMAEAID